MISTKGRYALRFLADVAEHQGGGYVPLKDVAARQEISEKYLESIIKLLVRGKLLTGLRGKGGGYRLNREPAAYTIAGILRLTEDTLAPVACLDEAAEPCPRQDQCRTVAMWQGLDRVIQTYLDGITLAQLLQDAPTEPAESPR